MPEKAGVAPVGSARLPHRVAPSYEGFDAENVISLLQWPREYLSVQLQFHRVPIAGLKVQLTTLGGESVCDAKLVSDANGWVHLSTRVPAGIYKCLVEHQAPALVSTVVALEQPYPVLLPVGRPYAESRGQPGFRSRTIPNPPRAKPAR